MLSCRGQLVVGAEPHMLEFQSYLLQLSIRFRATGAFWAMSSELRGAAASSRAPWIMWNHAGFATCSELIYIIDGKFVSCAERVAQSVRDCVGAELERRKALR